MSESCQSQIPPSGHFANTDMQQYPKTPDIRRFPLTPKTGFGSYFSCTLACLTFPSGKLSNSPEMLSSSITPLSLQANIHDITSILYQTTITESDFQSQSNHSSQSLDCKTVVFFRTRGTEAVFERKAWSEYRNGEEGWDPWE